MNIKIKKTLIFPAERNKVMPIITIIKRMIPIIKMMAIITIIATMIIVTIKTLNKLISRIITIRKMNTRGIIRQRLYRLSLPEKIIWLGRSKA
jgi:hypothetical protein